VKSVGDEELEKIYDKAKEIACFKNKIYGDLWKRLDNDILFSTLKLKVERASVCIDRGKKIDDLFDTINYAVFLIAKLSESLSEE
jgi:hypothetical protein